MGYIANFQGRVAKSTHILLLLLVFTMMLSACNGDTQAQQRATVQKTHLDRLVAHARDIGVPGSMLQPIVRQEEQISNTRAPVRIFSNQQVNDYYNNMARRYGMLAVEVSSLEIRVTQEFDHQAFLAIQDFEKVLAQREAQHLIEARAFADQLAQDQALLAKARYPREYVQITSSAGRSAQALRLMGSAYGKLQSLEHIIQQLEASRVDTVALAQEEQDDLGLFRSANKPEDFSYLIDVMGTQLQEATVLAIQAIPYFGAYEGEIKLRELRAAIVEGKKYGLDVATYQQRYDADRASLAAAKGNEYKSVLAQINDDIAAMQIPVIHAKANFFLRQFQQEVHRWGSRYQYWDSYDGNSYRLDYEYDTQGIGSDVAAAVQGAQTVDDYQAAITLINNAFIHLKAMEAEYGDRTPWDQSHVADRSLLRYYHLYNAGTGSVLVVSLIDQVMRLYQDGRFVRAFQVTTGQYERPSPPGLWNIFLREHPTEFKSTEPPGSAFWYPPTKIEYAMEYHDGGYFFHDSWWRADYGVGTNFPHYDSGGDEAFAGNGSHGCINMVPDDAAWLYNHTGYGATVIVY